MTESESISQSKTPRRRGWLVPSLVGVVVLVVLVAVFREFVLDFLGNVVPVFFTPFLLEVSVASLGLLAVIAVNSILARREQQDEWVYLAQVDPESEAEKVPSSLVERASSTVLKSVCEGVDADAVRLESVEGFLELGMWADAGKELLEVPEEQLEAPGFLRLRLLLCLCQGKWQLADELAARMPSEEVRGIGEDAGRLRGEGAGEVVAWLERIRS